MPLPLLAVLFIFLSPFFRTACSAATNRTIDDTYGDSVTGEKPVYSPSTPHTWDNASCAGCLVKPDNTKAFNGTWTAATYNPGLQSMSIDLKFKGDFQIIPQCLRPELFVNVTPGTALYVYFILPNTVPDATTLTECAFELDGTSSGSFRHDPTSSTDYLYRDSALVYVNKSLPNADHTFRIATTGLDHNVFVAFDYAMYT
jgi:hypothetical protein